MFAKVIFAGALLATASPAIAKDDEPADGEKKEKVICRTEKVTGSRTRVNRICMTKSEWEKLEADTKQWVDGEQRGASGGTNPSWQPGNQPGVPQN